MDTPGLTNVRDLPVFGYTDQEGHCELLFEDVRVPRTNLIGEEGGGFAIAQARLGPGRIHHCMRAIGVAERALEAMCRRVTSRTAFGKPLSEQGVIQEWIADSRMEIEQARLLVLKTAWLMDTVGNKGARIEICAIKVGVPNMALRVVDRAIQAHGGGGVGRRLRAVARMYARPAHPAPGRRARRGAPHAARPPRAAEVRGLAEPATRGSRRCHPCCGGGQVLAAEDSGVFPSL